MGRRRFYVEGLSLHVRHRGNNRMPIFLETSDYELYLEMMAGASRRAQVDVNAFALMTTHTHLVVTPSSPDALPRMMQVLGARYGRYFNRTYGRIGTVWNGRYSASLIDDERYWLTCLRYVEQNPLRAKMVAKPEDYRWSSYAAHAYGHRPHWLTYHPIYESLGSTPEARQIAYRGLCGQQLTFEETALSRAGLSARAAILVAG
jgi:putative transposase